MKQSGQSFTLSDFASKKGRTAEKSAKKTQPESKKSLSSNNNRLIRAGEIIIDMAKKVDLHALHSQVIHYFDTKEEDLQRLKRRETVLTSEETDSIEEQLRVEDELNYINSTCEKLASRLQIRNNYEEKSQNLLDQHDEICPRGQIRIIGDNSDNLGPNDFAELTYIVNEFVGLAQGFIQVTVKRNNSAVILCSACNVPPINIDGKQKCPHCNRKIKIFEQRSLTEGYQDSSLLKNDYYRSETFEDIMAAFQGKQRWQIPDKVWDAIGEYCLKYRLSQETLCKEDIYNILKIYGLSDHYIDINYIAFLTSNGDIPLPSISKLEDILLVRHRLVEEEFEHVKDIDQKNFMRGQYVLWVLLQMEDFKCNIEDFKMLETRDVILRHDKKMKKICENLHRRRPDFKWEFIGLA